MVKNKINKDENIVERLEKFLDNHSWCMSDFQKAWNTKNQEKITEMVKIQTTILVRFGNHTVRLFTDKLYL